MTVSFLVNCVYLGFKLNAEFRRKLNSLRIHFV